MRVYFVQQDGACRAAVDCYRRKVGFVDSSLEAQISLTSTEYVTFLHTVLYLVDYIDDLLHSEPCPRSDPVGRRRPKES